MIKYAALSLLLIGYISCSDRLLKSNQMNIKEMSDQWFEFHLNVFKKQTKYEEFESMESYCNAILAHSEFLPDLNNGGVTTFKGVRIDRDVLNNKELSLNKQNKKKNKSVSDINFLNQVIEQNKKEEGLNQPLRQKAEPQNRKDVILDSLKYFGINTKYEDVKNIHSEQLHKIVSFCREKKFNEAYSLLQEMNMIKNHVIIYDKIFEYLDKNVNYKFSQTLIKSFKKTHNVKMLVNICPCGKCKKGYY